MIYFDNAATTKNKPQEVYDAAFEYKDENYNLSLGGEYQIFNAITAIEVLKAVAGDWGRSHLKMNSDFLREDTIYEGVLATKWDGRFTVARTSPLVIVDGAHNEDAWLRLRESLDKYFTNEKIIYIMGVFADKEYDKMIRILAPTMKKCYTVESDSPRALSAAQLAGKLRLAGVEAESVGDVKLAIDYALDRAGRNDRIVVCGTLSITGAALKYLNK